MSENQLENNTEASTDTSSMTVYDDKVRLARIVRIAVGVLLGIGILILIIHFLLPKSEQSKNIDSATTAARKQIPNAQVRNVKVADGFALATVSDPNASGQASAGNVTIFKINKDGSMAQIANGSFFSPIDLLNLGITLPTQAKLTGHTISQVRQSLANICGYTGGDEPGYSGFNGSFNPDGWQIDSGTLDDLEQVLTTVVSDKNTTAGMDQKVICVNATRNNSSATTDMQTYISTFALGIQFITSSGTLSAHKLTFAIGSNNYHSYTLDGQAISVN